MREKHLKSKKRVSCLYTEMYSLLKKSGTISIVVDHRIILTCFKHDMILYERGASTFRIGNWWLKMHFYNKLLCLHRVC